MAEIPGGPSRFDGGLPRHQVWTDNQVAVIRFIRWAVLNRRITDGDDIPAMAARSALTHRHPTVVRPRQWYERDVRVFEDSGAK